MIRLIALAFIATPAAAQDVPCFDRMELIADLDTQYDECQMVRALPNNGGMIEVYVSPTGTWTMVFVQDPPNLPTACVLATGGAWMMIAPGIDG